ncbi:hypothetical protein [Bacillus halotolerans]|uniref:hypothetical protein n=1 Tax=Bacillus halotolerans TaxID=260554 RepID=UPI002DBF8D55|nr:hypothetical protein [Bacillus halotolerans]MEC1604612.1 hypothetical protein [Bacillus halotolerans]
MDFPGVLPEFLPKGCWLLYITQKILFLDESKIGLDIVAKRRIQQFLHVKTEHKTTILLTSHQIDDVEHFCKRIILIEEGEIKFDGPKDKLSQLTNSKRSSAVEVDAVHADWGLLSCQPTEVKGKYI